MTVRKSYSEEVTKLMAATSHPLENVVQALREAILETSMEIREQVKWNSPAFYYTGEMAPFDPKEYKRDIIVLHLRKKDRVLLVFPTGAKIKDTSGVLEGEYTDGRRMVTLESMAAFNVKKEALQQVIRQWISQIEK